MKFYGIDIDHPLSQDLGENWGNSPLSRLSDGSYLMELRDHPNWPRLAQAKYAWRVVGAEYSGEDSTVTRFEAYGPEGQHLPFARLGVNFNNCGQIGGGFEYPLWHGNKYYLLAPGSNEFVTVATSGYVATVLDTEHPSECMAFGLHKEYGHRCLVISFRLMPFDADTYPNDV